MNALKFSKEDESCTIHISYQDVELIKLKYLKISISDNGIGFSNESVSKMFDPFVRLNAKDKYEGTGLGLALCKSIVEKHNGLISATGVKDQGAEFTILLPLFNTKNKNV